MESVVPSKRAPVVWSYNEELPIRNGIGVDGKRKH